MLHKFLPAVLALTCAAIVHADEADIKKALEARLNTKVESVGKTGYLGLYEVFADGAIYYTDEKASVLLIGGDLVGSRHAVNLVDLKQGKNVTDERMRKLTAVKFSELPLERAIKQVRGNGKRVIATFEDPNCGYCKRLAKDLQKLDNSTVYVFLYPILSEDSLKKSKQIWCATDRAKAWSDWMVEGRVPAGKDDCDTSAITKNQEFGRRLGISGTPTILFSDGERWPGAKSLAEIEQKLAQAAK